MKLSAVIITLNEGANIERCLKSVAFCDEIILVDAGSRDHTLEIATRYQAKVFERPWAGYTQQRNDAVKLASGDWILSIDADEEVSEGLRAEISAELARNPTEVAFTIPRKTIHFKRWIRRGGWYPNRLVRLFRKDKGLWEGGALHEYWKAEGQIGALKNDLLHHSFRGFSDQVARNNRYSTLGAEDLKKQGVRFSLLALLMRPFAKFVETYFLKRGFMDGYPGFMISISAAYSVFSKWSKLWEMENVGEN